jgi:3',5'-cyclic AMP phosphodiesterase CpdA
MKKQVDSTSTKKPKKAKKIIGKILLALLIIIVAVAGLTAVANIICIKSNSNFIKTIATVEYDSQLAPTIADDGYYTFVTDDNFKVMQLTDVHIGGGYLSVKKDSMAINAVAAMISEEKPDLVIVTGDIAYPVPFQAGTLNNKQSAKLFAQLMEQLGVYWAPAFGNHDTEAYSYYSREAIGELYESGDYPHCLFQAGDESVDGVGNYVVNVKNTAGEITQSLFMLDSHSYVDNDYFGIMWKYDCVHQNQVDWYKAQVSALTEENNGTTPKSLAFFHIPPIEMRNAYYEYRDNDFNDTDDVQYIYGKAGEVDNVVYSSEYNYGLFDAFKELGSTQGAFFGHDHVNNMSLNYQGIKLTYGYSIDYLAYSGISKYGTQRGCTIIDIAPDGTFDNHLENYYQDKYKSTKQKESVTMADYNS